MASEKEKHRQAYSEARRSERFVRLQKYLATCGVASRRKAEEMIVAGQVSVNGSVVTELGTKVDVTCDKVSVDGRDIKEEPKGILLFHKPKHVVSTMLDPEGRPSIGDYITKRYRSYFPVGRLDFESTGLMVLTNDGDLANRLLHPRYGAERIYEVLVDGELRPTDIARLKSGVSLEDGVSSAKVRYLGSERTGSWYEVEIYIGKNRIIRRLMDAVDHPVMELKRISHGPFQLGTIRPGDIEKLDERQYERVKRTVYDMTQAVNDQAGSEQDPID